MNMLDQLTIEDLLTTAAIVVVLVGLAVAAWQILGKRARIIEVAPVLIGAFFIAASAQIASMML